MKSEPSSNLDCPCVVGPNFVYLPVSPEDTSLNHPGVQESLAPAVMLGKGL